jgi:hypothetical protein
MKNVKKVMHDIPYLLFCQVQDLTKFHKCTEKIKHNLANVLQSTPPVNIP